MNPLVFLLGMGLLALALCTAVGGFLILHQQGEEFDHDSVQLHENEEADERR